MSETRRAYRPKPKDEIARNMSAIRSTGNRTEVALRSELHRLGLRFRKYAHHLPGRPDIVFPGPRVAVFVDGDYWHGRVLREKGRKALEGSLKTSNRNYWLDKLERNAERDHKVTEALRSEGWLVMRFWESDVKGDVRGAAETIAFTVRNRTGQSQG